MSALIGLRRPRASLILMLASGFAGLGYQIVWTQQCAFWLGHEAAAVLAVVAAFFGGLAVGAFALGPYVEASERPVLWYAGCEFVIATWSALLAFGMSPFSAWMLRLIGAQPTPAWQWTLSFCGTLLLLLPATAAMGLTLPAMERMTASLRAESRSIAALYAGNTFGAVAGVLITAFWSIPALGLQRTAGLCIALNLLCGVASLFLFPGVRPASPHLVCRLPSRPHGVLAYLAVTGFLGIGYEVLVVRVLSEVTEDTVYTFAVLLAVYLVGSAIGAASYQRWLIPLQDSKQLSQRLLCALAAACLIGTASLWAADYIKTIALRWLGASMTAAIAAETSLALVAFGLPTLVMGAVFSHLSARASVEGVSFGRSLAMNTLGAATAPLIVGVLALPSLGPKLTLLLICFAYLTLAARQAWRAPIVWVPACIALAFALWAPPLAFIDVPKNGHVISYQEGVMAAVSVVEDVDGVEVLRINNRQQEGSSASLRVDGRQAWLPILLHPAPKRALFLGLGTGVTASSAAQDPMLEVDAVELLPEVLTASAHFRRAFSDSARNSRLHLLMADARRYVRASDRQYDVIVADNFHPARSGSGALYTTEHFAAVRDRLSADGVFCQWLPLHQLDLQTLRSIVRSFQAVYPQAWALLANNSLETPVLGLVGRRDVERFDLNALRGRLTNLALQEQLAQFGVEDEFALLGSFVAGPEALRRFAGDAALNTDDHPVVAYRAPRITYAPDSQPRDRLIALLQALSIRPTELVDASSDAAWSQRLTSYWAARDRFIESGRHVLPASNVQDMLKQVREPLLSVLRISPDFRPAYDPLIRMATLLARTDVSSARALLLELQQAQPARPEAESILDRLAPTL